MLKQLLAGAALSLVLATGAYAQSSQSVSCPSGTMTIQKAKTDGAGKGPRLAETEGATNGPKLAETEGVGKGPRLASAEGSASPKLASAPATCQ